MERTRESVDPKFTFSAGAGENGAPRTLDFFTLPRAVQERFLASTLRTAPPAPILFAPAKKTRAFVWGGIAVAFAIATFAATRVGFGDVASALAFHRTPMLATYAALVAAATFAVVRALVALHALRSLPWAPGIYVFPSSVIDARSHKLRVYAMRDLEKMERAPTPVSTFHFVFASGAKLSFPVP